jgi:transposase
MTPEDIAALLRRNLELEIESKLRRKETKLLRDELAQRNERVAALKSHVGGLKGQVSGLEGQVSGLQGQLVGLGGEIEQLKGQLAWFQKQLFGAKSEKRILEALSPDDQLWLGQQMRDLPEEPPSEDQTAADVEEATRPPGPPSRKRPPRSKGSRSPESESSRLRFDDSVPVEVVIVEDPKLAALPKDQVEIIGEDVTYRLAQRSSYFVKKFVKVAWKVKGEDEIYKPKVASVVERSIADASFLAGLAVEKHCHHLPLYRQHQRLAEGGIHVERSTLTRLLQRVAEMCDLVYTAQLSSILQSSVITMDESPTPAGRAGGKMKKGYYWVLYGDQNEVAFVYSPTRARSVIDKLLEGFQGTLHSDGYRAYESFCNSVSGVCWAGCWAHTRRKFIEAEHKAPEKVKRILGELQLLYEIEARGREKPELLAELRDKESRPIVNRLFDYIKNELAESMLLPSNKFVKALAYARKHEAPLRVFLDNDQVAVDTNHVERTIRYAVMGRKNWMFHSTEDGARYSGILYSLLQTCYLQGVDPTTYLIDILQRMDTHPGSDIFELTPLNWTATVNGSPMRAI